MTNREFANAVGCSPTMASRMRNGQRAPSVQTLAACIEAFELNGHQALEAADSPEAWGSFLRAQVFSRTGAPAHVEGTVQPEGAAQ